MIIFFLQKWGVALTHSSPSKSACDTDNLCLVDMLLFIPIWTVAKTQQNWILLLLLQSLTNKVTNALSWVSTIKAVDCINTVKLPLTATSLQWPLFGGTIHTLTLDESSSTTVASLPWPLCSVPKVAVVKTFNCIM